MDEDMALMIGIILIIVGIVFAVCTCGLTLLLSVVGLFIIMDAREDKVVHVHHPPGNYYGGDGYYGRDRELKPRGYGDDRPPHRGYHDDRYEEPRRYRYDRMDPQDRRWER